MHFDHLSSIDALRWPGVATVPSGRILEWKSRRAEAALAKALADAGVSVGKDCDLTVRHEALFLRLAGAGWTGLAESYMAGEWFARSDEVLVTILSKLLAAGYHPSTPSVAPAPAGGQLPPSLVRLFSGDGMSAFQGVYASGVATTSRESVTSYVPGAGRGREAAKHFVDVTVVSPPIGVDRRDLGDAQKRAATQLCELAHVRENSHVLVYPASGGQVELVAAEMGATVDAITTDQAMKKAQEEQLLLAGSDGSTHLELVEKLSHWRGRYDAVLSAEVLETLSGEERFEYLRSMDRLLSVGGRVGLQTTVATETFSRAAESAVQMLRAYVWPGLRLNTMSQLHKLVDRHTNLRITQQRSLGSHHQLSVQSQRAQWAAHSREAAAEGYDIVFRRLMTYQFALREALLDLGMLDGAVLMLVHRNRGGHR